MRIASLLPSATEILFAIGAGGEVVGVSHECDYPPAAAWLPALTSSAIGHGRRSSAGIDRHIRRAAHAGSSPYHLDERLLGKLRPDLTAASGGPPAPGVPGLDLAAHRRRALGAGAGARCGRRRPARAGGPAVPPGRPARDRRGRTGRRGAHAMRLPPWPHPHTQRRDNQARWLRPAPRRAHGPGGRSRRLKLLQPAPGHGSSTGLRSSPRSSVPSPAARCPPERRGQANCERASTHAGGLYRAPAFLPGSTRPVPVPAGKVQRIWRHT